MLHAHHPAARVLRQGGVFLVPRLVSVPPGWRPACAGRPNMLPRARQSRYQALR